jgi:hypothetical protein
MRYYRTELGPVIYNPETCAFEARVTFHEGPTRETYPCSLRLPIDTEAGIVACAIVRQAREMRRQHRVPLRSRLSWRQATGPLRAA